MQHVCGPSFSLLKHSDTHSELTTLLIETFLELRQSSQAVVTESMYYEPIREEVNSYTLKILQTAVEELKTKTQIPASKFHVLVLKETSIISIYSGEGASELQTQEILFLIIVVAAFSHYPSSSTHNSLLILEKCVPYRIHLKNFDNGLSILVMVEAGISQISRNLHTLLVNLTTSKNLDLLQKQIENVKKLARKLNRNEWSETLVWRPNLKLNSSALSSLARRIQYGFETICLDPSLLFVAVEHVAVVIERIKTSIPVLGLSQACRLSPILQFYPGLVHFVLIDRKQHRNLLKMGVEDEEPGPVNYFQLFCIHLALTNPDVVLQQSRQIAMKLKEHIFPGSSELEDLC
uniref:EOG090X07YB n=1 Tax=Evadne anonyx TaxID=141404 RepID=A0A9N6WXS9_9CRUS|nr:EOG090X07YB [Evadne anonyx]